MPQYVEENDYFKFIYAKDNETRIQLNKLQLKKRYKMDMENMIKIKKSNFVLTRHSLSLMEQIACCIEKNESVLLVGETVLKLERSVIQVKDSFAFNFVRGTLIGALENGVWLLLDEINLASSESLGRLCGVLEKLDVSSISSSSITLIEKGETKIIKRHKNFRLFANMNPPTDYGKRNWLHGLEIGLLNFMWMMKKI